MRPIIKILIIFGVLGFLGLGVYFGWQVITGPDKTVKSSPPPSTGLKNMADKDVLSSLPILDENEAPLLSETVKKPVMRKISDAPVSGFIVNSGTREVYYVTERGKVFIVKEGPDFELASQEAGLVREIIPDARYEKLLAVFGDGPRSLQWGVFDVADGVWRPLRSDIVTAAWGADNDELIAVARDGKNTDFVRIDLFDPAAPYEILVRDFGLRDVTLTALTDNRVLIMERPSATYQGRIWEFSTRPKELKTVLSARAGLMARAAKDLDTVFIFSSLDDFSIAGGSLELKFPVFFSTLPHKCATPDGARIYCFAPQSIPSHAVMPDDYLKRSFFSEDTLFEIDVSSGEVQARVASGREGFQVFDGVYPQFAGNSLHFMNRYDGYLYQIEFPPENNVSAASSGEEGL